MKTTDSESSSGRGSSVLRELLWLAPTIAVTAFVVVLVMTSGDAETLAAVIGIVLAVLGIAISFILFRLQSSTHVRSSAGRPAGIRSHVLSYTTSAVLVALSTMWPFSGDDPDLYFDRDQLRVAINGELPGWSLETGGEKEGFDIALAKHIQKAYGIKEIKWVKVSQAQREHMWDGTQNTEEVDLVISAFSITPERLAMFDMAGPYYLDKSMALANGDKPQVKRGEILRGCAVEGTTGKHRLADVQARIGKDLGAIMFVDVPEKLSTCYKEFFDDSDTKYIASDWSIIRVFNQNATIVEADADRVPLVTVSMPDAQDSARQAYGVALRQNHPNVCRDLSDKIADFLKHRWDDEFMSTLGTRGC
ncbi:ABC-type amino acid transport substrate-binding protein [Lentzea xinjiangensis]|uniref:ABC-type amino acid transport substrate-binding protein n=1 Tax=Lentzea xinjiangensis TaxID=402600 RepID=A0A1H9G6J0_9PSEU|nr:transporter substrate-binding domain-containing protein [Lentzea xinjiangensis]SEQ45653.1 ABC-type amino acid transport substrate-binding protein [Lentzea xinjiangensis]